VIPRAGRDAYGAFAAAVLSIEGFVSTHPEARNNAMSAPIELSEKLASLVEHVGPSVVRVEGGRHRPTSGIVWSANRVLTVAHGLEREELIVGVEGAELKAKVKGKDPSTDLALLEVEGALPPATFGDGAALKVGQLVLRLGRPGETVRATAGILSAVGKKPFRGARGGEIDRYLEADAGHEPGFSGGPLVTLDGTVVGLTSTGVVPRTSVNVPTVTLRRVVEQLEQHGHVRRSYLGLSLQPLHLPEAVREATGEELGLLVVGVEKGGPADAAGVVYGDTVLHLGDASVRTLDDFYAYLRADHAGSQVPARLYRGGQVVTLQLTLGAR
jgi:S1-C subfamily serine protease